MKEWQKWLDRHYENTKKGYKELCYMLSITQGQLERYVRINNLKKKHKAIPTKYTEDAIFALYDRDDILCVGTLQEIAHKHDYKISTLKFFGSKSARKRNRSKRLILLED